MKKTNLILTLGTVLLLAPLTSALAQSVWETVDELSPWRGRDIVADTNNNFISLAIDNGVTGSGGVVSTAVSVSTNHGVNWDTVGSIAGYALDLAAASDGALFAVGNRSATVSGRAFLWQSLDHGATWTEINPGVGQTGTFLCLDVAAGNNGSLYLSGYLSGGSQWVVRKGDRTVGGIIWSTVDVQSAGQPQSVVARPGVAGQPDEVFVGGGGWTVRRSTDSGATWATVDNYASGLGNGGYSGLAAGIDGSTYAVLRTAKTLSVTNWTVVKKKLVPVVTTTTEYGWQVRKSTNSGASWANVDYVANGWPGNGPITVDAFGRVFIVGYNNVTPRTWLARGSIDGGATWVTTDLFLPAGATSSQAVAIASDVFGNVCVIGETGTTASTYTAPHPTAGRAVNRNADFPAGDVPVGKPVLLRRLILSDSINTLRAMKPYRLYRPAPPRRLGRALSLLRPRIAFLWATLGCAALVIVTQPTQAGVIEAWVQRTSNVQSNSSDYASKVVREAAGDIIVAGSTDNGFTGAGALIIKYSGTNGAVLWQHRYSNFVNVLAVDGSGNAVVAGSSSNGTNNDFYTAKYGAADGAVLWEKRYNGPVDGDDSASAVAIDTGGNVLVTGSSYNSNGNYDYYTAKYAATNGALLWEHRHNGPANGYDYPAAVAMDSNGNLIVTGTSWNGNNGDYYTVKYAAADGTLLWEQRHNDPANSGGHASAVAVDGSGNVVVTGNSYSGPGSYQSDYYTAKYAAADGELLWEQSYNGPLGSGDYASAVAVDGSGNVVVTGASINDGGYYTSDYYTAKYAAADGALLWEQRYNGPGNGEDVPSAVAVDGSGNVVVTGTSTGSGTGLDWFTAKYATEDGTLLWEKRYNGPANGDETMGGSHSLALGPNGIVAITGSSDGHPGPGITYNFATVVYQENLPPVAIERVPAGIRLRFIGAPGRSYEVQRAPAATGPWSTTTTLTAPINGLVDYTDTNPPTDSAFYRTSTQ